MKGSFPIHGYLGIILLILSEILLFKKIEPFYSWFYCFAWWSYILFIDAIIYRLKGNSLILNRTKEFLLMIPWSIFIWLIFESANLSLKNWYYINLPHSLIQRWSGYAIAYGTVLPGMFETTEFLESIGFLRHTKSKGTVFTQKVHYTFIGLGALFLISSILIPIYCFPLIWVGFTFLLDPLVYRWGGKSLLREIENGNPRKIYLLLLSGLICGILWEFWNYWALSKWIYTVPFFEEMKGFEMPFLGFLGFPPFAVQCYVMYNFISLFRFQRGWEELNYLVNAERKTKPNMIILTIILIGSFSVLIFKCIDVKTVDSFYPRLKDAYWIEPKYRRELPRVGITTLDDLILRTKDKKERDELALRLLIHKETLAQWIEKAQLVQLKGLGMKNLQILEKVDIHSISDLAEEDPNQLYGKIKPLLEEESIQQKAKIRIWIREAKKRGQSVEW